MMPQIHNLSYISDDVSFGKNVIIGPFCNISGKIKIGDNCKLISNVNISGNTTIGNDNIFFPFSSIGTTPQDLKYKGENSQLHIGNNNTFRENVTISTGTKDGGMVTKILDNNLFMTGSHIAHDCKIGNNNIFVNQVTLGGHVNIMNNVVIGGLSAIIQYVTIGSFSMIGGMSGIDKNVLPFSLVIGNRAKLRGLNLVGIRRNKFNKKEIDQIRSIHNNLFNKKISLNQNNKVDSIFLKYESIVNKKLGHIQN